jgi:hypothetical protein
MILEGVTSLRKEFRAYIGCAEGLYIPTEKSGGRGIRTPEGLAALAVFKNARKCEVAQPQ